jgi:hypothetical protein
MNLTTKGNKEMKKAILAAMLFASIGSAQAQVTGNLSAATDYRFRGISQTQNSQAFQGGIDYSHASGLYVGNWNSNVSNKLYTDSNGLESDVYAGFKKEVVKGVTVDVGSYNYIYSRSTDRFGSNSNTNEVFGAVTTGPVTLKYSQSLGDYFGAVNSKNSKYVQADVKMPIMAKLTADAHIGRVLITNNKTNNFTDVNFGVTYNLAGFGVGAHYFTNRGLSASTKLADTVAGEKLYKNAFLVSVSKSF